MRLGMHSEVGAGMLLCLLGICGTGHAQDTAVLAPEASAAKSRQVIQQSIQALGGAAYLGVKDSTRAGRYSRFEHSGAVSGTVKMVVLDKYPDMQRIQYIFRRYIETYIPLPIDVPYRSTNTAYEVHNKDQGWMLGGGPVEELPPDLIEPREEERKRSVNVVFRERLNDPNLVLRYAGVDVVDLKQVEWVEASDGGPYTARIAIETATHLPNRTVYNFRDKESRQIMEIVEFYSNYHTFQGVVTPMQILRQRQGWLSSQFFVEEIKYNTGLSDAMFTREGLEELRAHSGKNKKDKDN